MSSFSSYVKNAPAPAQPQPGLLSRAGSFIANTAKDAVNTLITTPAIRTGQAIGQLARPFLSKEQNANMDVALQKPVDVPVLGTTVEPQKGGLAGAEQIGGNALKSASYLYGGQGLGNIAENGIVGGVIQGAKTGTIAGGLGNAGQAMTQGQDTGNVLGAGAQGAVTGAVAGGVVGGIGGGVSNVWERAYTPKASSYDTNLTNATIANNQAGTEAINAIHEASDTLGDVNRGLGNQFAQAPAIITKTDPNAGTLLNPKIVDKLNALKDTKAFSIPEYIREPGLPSEIGNIGNGNIKLNPSQTQDLITQLNDLKFNSKGDVVVNQQTSSLIDDIKNAAQSGMGHVTDAQGNSIWNSAYQDYHQGKDAMDAMSKIIPVKKFPGEILDPTEVNNSVNKMLKMMETPQGTSALIRGNNEFKNVTGYDLLGDPMGTISKLAESDKAFAEALKGGYGHQFVQGLKNPNAASRRVLYAVSSIVGITALATTFRRQLGSFLSGQ